MAGIHPESEFRTLENANRFRWLEYHKWRFDAEWYTPLVGNLVLKSSIKIGMLGFYDSNIGLSPFERFVLGGDGLAGQQFGLLGNDIISLRGYEVNDLPASNNGGASVFDKLPLLLELSKKSMRIIRYAFILSFFYNLIGLYFAVTGQLSPVVAAILMPLSSISIVVFTTVATNLLSKKYLS